MAIQKRPYELSVWSEELFEEGQKKETKMLIIGAHDMTYDGRAIGIKLVRKVNGTNTLTFQMLNSFFDSQKGEMVYNEFIDELFAERKIKLHYKDKWWEFYIKSVKEEKKHKSVLKIFTCQDAFIDELARNGYGITFDEELYNNVEEIGTFTEEILEDSIWTYTPEYNWGDFTEYTEEKLFKIKVSNFINGEINAYKLQYYYNDFEGKIKNISTEEQRNIELGDDLARKKEYYWDQYDEDSLEGQTYSKHKLKENSITLNSSDYEYIYVPYSCLDFCYINYNGHGSAPSGDYRPDRAATEVPAVDDSNRYYVAPAGVDPNTIIQFIAFKKDDKIEVDETGLIVDKKYHYFTTLKDWNRYISANKWYIFNDKRFVETTYGDGNEKTYSISYTFKYIYDGTPARSDLGNKCLTYDGYLNGLNNIETIKGKKISITDRSEINISDDIDSFVTVYNNQSDDNEIINYYINDEWQGTISNYRVCSRSSTRQILPTLAKNFAENAINIESTTGWEIMYRTKTGYIIEPDIKYRVNTYIDDEGNEQKKIVASYIAFLTGEDGDSVQQPDESDEGIKYWTKEDVENADWEWLRIRIPMEYPDFTPRYLYISTNATPYTDPWYTEVTGVEPYSSNEQRACYGQPQWESPYNCLTGDTSPIFSRVSYEAWQNDQEHTIYYYSDQPWTSHFYEPDRNTPLAAFLYSSWYDAIRDNNSEIGYQDWVEVAGNRIHQGLRYWNDSSRFTVLADAMRLYTSVQLGHVGPYDLEEQAQAFVSDFKCFYPLGLDSSYGRQHPHFSYKKFLKKIESIDPNKPDSELTFAENNRINIHYNTMYQLLREYDIHNGGYINYTANLTRLGYKNLHRAFIDPELSSYDTTTLKQNGYDLPVTGIGGIVKPPNKGNEVFENIEYHTQFLYLFVKKNNDGTVTFYLRNTKNNNTNNSVLLQYIPVYKNIPLIRALEIIEILEGHCSFVINPNNPENSINFSGPELVDEQNNFIEIDKDHQGDIALSVLQDEFNLGGAARLYLERKKWNLLDDLNVIKECNANIDPYNEDNPSGKITFQFFNTPTEYKIYESIQSSGEIDPDIDPNPSENNNDNQDNIARHTIINFGAVSQNRNIKKNQVYCLGLKVKIKQKNANTDSKSNFNKDDFVIKIAEGSLKASGRYNLNFKKKISFTLEDFFGSNYKQSNFITTNIQPWKYFYEKTTNKEFNEADFEQQYQTEYSTMQTAYILFSTDFDIENPYIAITSLHDYLLEELTIFEAYTKGFDHFTHKINGQELIAFSLTGRNFYLDYNIERTIKYKLNNEWHNIGKLYIQNIFNGNIQDKILFESDIMTGETYEYQKYFIQQLYLKNEDKTYDTFKAKAYLSEQHQPNSLPLDKAKYNEDDYEIITNEIDMSLCEYYRIQDGGCSHTEGICYYQKYGFCPYLFETEKHCRRIRTLKGEKSNRFNLTQELSKIFKCYPVYHIEHESNGIVKKDSNNKMIKNVYYITEKGKDNIYGFRYGQNLSNITRNIVSDQIVTKLYVNDVDSEYSKTGLCSIKTAEDNPSKDSFIIDLSYYAAKGMISAVQLEKDLYGITQNNELLSGYLKVLGYYNSKYDKLSNQIINLRNNSFNDIEAHLIINFESINVIVKELKEYSDNLARYSSQKESTAYRNYMIKFREAEVKFYDLLKQTFNPIAQYRQQYPDIQINEESFNYIKWFDELELLYEYNYNISGIEKFLNKIKEEHTWQEGLLGQYNAEYLQLTEWEKSCSHYLQLANQITLKFFRKYEPFLKEGTWSDTNYLTDNAYYHGALDVSAQGAIPKVEYSISVIDLSPFEGYEDYELDNADTTYIEDVSIFGYNQLTGFPNHLKVIVSEISEELDVPTNNSIKVQNFTTQFEDLFQQVTATVQNLTLNENIYRRASNFTSLHDIKEESLQNTLDNNTFTLVDSQQKNVNIDQTGQSGSNINNRTSKYKLTGEGLYFSNDGGVSWKKGVTPDQKTELDIKSENIETSKISLINQYNKIDTVLESPGLECYTERVGTTNIDTFSYNNKGMQYIANGLKLIQFGTLIDDITNNYYGLKIKKNNEDIFNIAIPMEENEKSIVELNSNYNFSGDGVFSGRNSFSTVGYNVIIGGKINSNGSTYISIVNNNTNILTVFANGNAYMSGTIESYDTGDNVDYIIINNGKKIQAT